MIAWLDIPVTNLTRAEVFYEQVLNVQCQRQPSEPPSSLLVAEKGLCRITLIEHPKLKPSNAGSIIYLQPSQPLSLAQENVEKNEGKLLEKITNIGSFGSRLILLDSEGNRMALFEPHAQP